MAADGRSTLNARLENKTPIKMFKKDFSGLTLFQFQNLASQTGISHFVSSRSGGVSNGDTGELNLSFRVEDKPENVKENRRKLAQALQVRPELLFFPAQTHSCNIKLVKAETKQEDLEDTDALITDTPGICIAVMSADCVPILLYDTKNRVGAAIHAGWRGTVSKIAAKTIVMMQEKFSTMPENILAGIGPSICREAYEVGEDVIAEVENSYSSTGDILFSSLIPGKAYLDLWNANKLQLIDSGIPENSVEVSEICTFKNSDLFFSARKSKNKTGRFAAGIIIHS